MSEATAVVLSGGGAYGAFEIGVMKALCNGESPATDKKPLEPDIFTGTSVGSWNAACMTMEPGSSCAAAVRHLEGLWLNEVADRSGSCGNGVFRIRGNALGYLTQPGCFAENPLRPFLKMAGDAVSLTQSLFDSSASFLQSGGPLVERLLRFLDLSAFISIEPFAQLLKTTVRLEGIRHSNKKLRIIATNFDTGKAAIFSNEDMADGSGLDIIRASAAIPGIFPPVKMRESYYVDGGTVLNTPLQPAIQAGATTLHVIYLDPDVKNIPLKRLHSTIDTIERVFTISQAIKINEDIATIEWINNGLEAVERASKGEAISDEDMMDFVRVAAQIQKGWKRRFRKLTVHRYHPSYELGGPLGILDFNQQVLARTMEIGFMEAVEHDCSASKCILPQ